MAGPTGRNMIKNEGAIDPRLRRHPLGFLEIAQRPTAEELARYYADTYFQNEKGSYRSTYSDEEREVFDLRIAQKAAQADLIRGTQAPGSLLDVGCGEGFVLAAFALKGWDVAGIDYSRAGVDAMNPPMSPRVEQGDVLALLDIRIASGARYDLIWLGNVLEHVLDPVGLLSALRKLIRDNGVLVVTVPNDGSVLQEELLRTGDIPERFWIAVPDHLSYFTADSLRRTAEATGWDCRTILGEFPVDVFLAHPGSNYVTDGTRGPLAHAARLRLERLIGQAGTEAANRFYEALADVGLGRDLSAFLTLPQEEKDGG